MEWEGRLPLSSNRAGPFVSALTHVVLQLGQKPVPSVSAAVQDGLYGDGGTASHGKRKGDFGDSGESAKKARPGSANNRKGKAKSAKSRASVTLKDLVDLGVILPGHNKISVAYKGVNYTASLGDDGAIQYQGKKFNSATAFSIHCKRMQTPKKQGDDGWKSTLYEGRPLENYRRKYLQESGLDAETAEDEGEEQTQQAALQQAAPQQQQQAQAPQQQQQEPAETDHWVQCDRCRTWRIVPDASWPAVEADTRESWFCEWATWDVRLQVPHNPSCMQRT